MDFKIAQAAARLELEYTEQVIDSAVNMFSTAEKVMETVNKFAAVPISRAEAFYLIELALRDNAINAIDKIASNVE